MSFRPLMRKSAIAQTAVAAGAFGSIVLTPRNVYAEAPSDYEKKGSIYDDDDTDLSPPVSQTITIERPAKITPTDRLAVQIRRSRLFLHSQVAKAEDAVNAGVASFIDLENSFTSTIASLAPAPQTGEKLMPGSLYVLVSAMAGSIMSRNRNILIRATFPLAVGIGAGWVVIPHTMRNVSDLLWKYETKFPVVADTHIRTREGVEKAIYMSKVHAELARSYFDGKLAEGREALEDWVKKGK